MEVKKKLDEAIEALTELRVNILKKENKNLNFSPVALESVLHEVEIKICQAHDLLGGWISTKDRLPEAGQKVLIVRDVRKWDKERKVEVDIANVHFSKKQEFGGPNSLTGSGYLKGIYFAVPSILHPDSVTYWQPIPSLPDEDNSVKVNNCTNCKHYVNNHIRQEGQTAHYCKVFNCLGESIMFECNEFEKYSH